MTQGVDQCKNYRCLVINFTLHFLFKVEQKTQILGATQPSTVDDRIVRAGKRATSAGFDCLPNFFLFLSIRNPNTYFVETKCQIKRNTSHYFCARLTVYYGTTPRHLTSPQSQEICQMARDDDIP